MLTEDGITEKIKIEEGKMQEILNWLFNCKNGTALILTVVKKFLILSITLVVIGFPLVKHFTDGLRYKVTIGSSSFSVKIISSPSSGQVSDPFLVNYDGGWIKLQISFQGGERK